MSLNKHKSEPTTASEIDQLFSATGSERDFRPFLCTYSGCNKSFSSFDQLQTHETNMHGTKKLVCGIDGCHKSFVTAGQLTKHRKMVHFRAARKAKLQAAAAAEAGEDSNQTPTTNPEENDTESQAAEELGTQDDKEGSVDIGNSEDMAWKMETNFLIKHRFPLITFPLQQNR